MTNRILETVRSPNCQPPTLSSFRMGRIMNTYSNVDELPAVSNQGSRWICKSFGSRLNYIVPHGARSKNRVGTADWPVKKMNCAFLLVRACIN